MKKKGSGSQNSPIAIDDSEDEVLQELCEVGSFTSSSTNLSPGYDHRKKPSEKHTILHDSGLQMSFDREIEGSGGSYRPTTQKRKRTNSKSTHDPILGFGYSNHPAPIPLEARFSGPISKKSRKRQRKLERQATEARQQLWADGAHHNPPDQMVPPNFQTWTADGIPYNAVQSLSLPSPPQYMNPSFVGHQRYRAEVEEGPVAPMASTSAWVSSMAMAGNTSMQPATEPWGSLPHLSPWPLVTKPSQATILSLPPRPSAAVRRPSSGSSHTNPAIAKLPLPPKPPPSLSFIGMKPDQDPSSKHGLFHIPDTPQASGEPKPGYIPNPARTLVMEQLPKTHRTSDFVNSWSKTACGAYPVYLSIDAPAAKALVEFATAELARKAWSSPKLGTTSTGLKPQQLKGRSREDLIRVWWYRVDGVGAGAGVGEIEEGEIEGDAAEKEIEVPVKKETKKERKARLARERQAKQKNSLPNAVQSTPATPNTLPPTVPPKPGPFPSTLPPKPYPNENQHAGPLPAPYSLPLPQPYQPPHQNRGPLLPSPQPRVQRRDMETLKKKGKIHHGVSIHRDANNSIVSDGSIASSRSPSPVDHILTGDGIPSGPKIANSVKQPTGDIELDEDMELDSPDNYRHPYPYFSSALPVPYNTNFSLPHHSSPVLVPQVPSIGGMNALPIVRETDPINFIPSTLPIASATSSTGPDSSSQIPVAFISTSPSTVSPIHAATPPLTPSEPRAMKNAPKGPSYAKRSLQARHKELEERIAKSKMELGLLSRTESPIAPENYSESLPTPPPSGSIPSQEQSTMDKQAMEEKLRSLVLQSQKNKSKTTISATSPIVPDAPTPTPPPSSNTDTVSPVLVSSTPATSVTTNDSSLDDLAVSFITETIQTYQAASKPLKPSFEDVKLELAAKQKRLEQHIAESKVLMARLSQARTKQEKDSILAVMREKSRMMEDESPIKHVPTTNEQPNGSGKALAPIKWPDSHHSTGIFVVSDDEDDSDNDNEGGDEGVSSQEL